MKSTVDVINYIPGHPAECLRIIEKEAYFFLNRRMHVYTFETQEACDEWKSQRSIENREMGFVEDYQACDSDGVFHYSKFYKIYASMGVVAPGPNCLAAVYGLDEALGVETEFEGLEDRILNIPNRERPANDNVIKVVFGRKEKLKQLTEASKLPEYMGELFLTEILLSTDQANRHLRDRAKLLGLA